MEVSGDGPDRRRGRYWMLFGASVVLIAATPMLPDGPVMALGRPVLRAVVLLGGLLAVWRRTRVGGLVAVLITLALAASVMDAAADLGGADVLVDVLGFIALGAIGTAIMLDILRAERVSTDTLFAAACVYLVMGLWWGKLHLLLEWAMPGSYELGLPAGATADDVDQVLTYFSFVTLSTLGYGDVLPASPAARNLASLQALMGQLYVAILVARLVGLHMRDREASR